MPRVQSVLSSTAYALFALEQPLPLADIAQGARAGAFPAAATHTPEWFAAAAEGSSLLDMAPELQVLPADLEEADLVDVSGIDLIHVYAPELHGTEPDEPTASEPASPVPAVEKPRTSTQIGLLKELGNLDD
jgi:hypothetical protein